MLIRTIAAALALGFAAVADAKDDAKESNDFPTLARVEYVLQCMHEYGGENYDNLYGCACTVDKIAEQFSYDEFSGAMVYANLRRTPGERGGVFRDPDQAGELRKKLETVREAAASACHLKDKTASSTSKTK